MRDLKKYFKANIIILIIILIIFLLYLFQDNLYVGSPYDKELISDKIILNVKDGNIDTIIEVVKEQTIRLADTDRLLNITLGVEAENHTISRYALEFNLKPKGEYKGYLSVICYFDGAEWFIQNMQMIYCQTNPGINEISFLSTEDAKSIYHASLDYLTYNNFLRMNSFSIKINTKHVLFTLFGIDENAERSIIKRFELNVKDINR